MTSRDFCFWLQGLFELQNPHELNGLQTSAVKRHLALVFKHEIDPSMGPEIHQAELNAIHAPSVAVQVAPRPVVSSLPGQQFGGIDENGHVLRC